VAARSRSPPTARSTRSGCRPLPGRSSASWPWP
jgi:hypothetical protein